jgi:cytoskeletal protein RodZ
MKKGNTLVIVFFVLLVILGFLVFLIKKQGQNSLKLQNIPQIFKNKNNQTNETNQTNINKPEIPTEEPVSSGLTLEITEPKANTTYNNPSIKVSGKTKANAEVYVNDAQTKADEAGNFSVNYNLDEGENLLTIVANDQAGNYAEKEITVFLQTQE